MKGAERTDSGSDGGDDSNRERKFKLVSPRADDDAGV